jgi:hypothetical protein
VAVFNYTPHRDFIPDLLFEVSRQNLSGFSAVLKFGRNVDVDTGAVEDIWDGGDSWSGPTVAAAHNVRSTNACDTGITGSGAGARTVDVQGLDASYISASETITLNGTTNVATTGSYIRIHRMIVRTAGSDGINHGNITACMPSDDTVTAQISASFNQTLMAIYTIAASKTGYITNYYASMNRNVTTGAANVFLKVQPDGETLQTKHILGLVGAGTSQFQHPFSIPLRVTEKSDIRIQSDASANNTDISAGFDLVLVTNE